MLGNIRERKNPKTGKSYNPKKWVCEIPFGTNPQTGKRERKTFIFNGTKAQAQKEILNRKKEYESGISLKAEKITVSKFLVEYIENRKAAGDLSLATVANYENYIYKWINPFIGAYTVKDIKPFIIEKWHRDAKKEGASGRTIQAAHKLIKMAFRIAVRDGLTLSNPFDLVNTPKAETKKRGYLIPSEAARMIQLLDNGNKTGFKAAIRLGLATGARRGEILALTWGDISLTNAQININKSLVQVDKARKANMPAKITKTTKTENGNRKISLDSEAVAWLRSWKTEQKNELMKAGVIQTNKTSICCSLYDSRFSGVAVFAGKTLDPSAFSSQFHKFCKANSFYSTTGNILCFHELRHTQATLLLASGEDVISVSSRMGHASPSITEDMYAHAMPERDRECAKTIGSIFSSRLIAV